LQRYLTQLLTNLPDTSMSGLDDWLPDHWKDNNPDPTPTAGVEFSDRSVRREDRQGVVNERVTRRRPIQAR
jgi:hypothetical protein